MMEQALRSAGFAGVESMDGVIYARSNPAWPEFTATPVGEHWLLALAWPVRATEAQIAGWTALHPDAPMDIYQGETRITLLALPQAEPLQRWAALTEAMVGKCVEWRRATRQRDEGM